MKWDAGGVKAANVPQAQPLIGGTCRKGWELPVSEERLGRVNSCGQPQGSRGKSFRRAELDEPGAIVGSLRGTGANSAGHKQGAVGMRLVLAFAIGVTP